jgi:hypothetical protein
MDDPNFIPEDQVGGDAPSAAPAASPAPAADFIPEDQVHGAASSDGDAAAGAFGAGMLKGIPFAKDIASAAVPAIKKAASYLPQNEDQKKALAGLPDSYTQARDQLDQNAADLNTAHPGYGFAGNMAGGAMMAPLMGGSGGIGDAIKSGIGYGAAQGAGEGRGWDRVTSAGAGAVAGGLGGLAGGMLAAPFQGAAKSAATDAASKFGVDMPRAIAGNPMQQGVAKIVGATPVGGAIGHATDKAVGQVGDAISDQAATIGGGTKESAVDNAVPAIRDWLDQGFKKEAQGIYAPLTPLNTSKVLGDMPNTRTVAQDLLNQQAGKNAEAAMPPAVQDVLDAATRPGGLTFGQMNGLKQDLGRSASWDARGDSDGFKRLYGALTDDVRNHAQAIGGNQGLVALDSANAQFATLMERNQAIRKMVGAGSDENVFDKFASKAMDNVGGKGRGGDLGTIAHVQQSIPEPAYNELVSGMVGRFGQQQDGTTSMQKFLNDWSSMTPRAKDIVFNTPGTQQVRQNLDQIQSIAEQLKNTKPASGSHMGGQFAAVEQGMELLHSVADQKWGKAALIAGTAIGGRQLSQYLASPVGSGALANVMKAYGNYARTPSPQTMQMVRATAAKAGQILGTRMNPMQSEGQARQ